MDICCSMASVFTPLTRKRSAGICQNNFQVLFFFFSLNVPPQDEEVLKKVDKYIFKQLYEVYEIDFYLKYIFITKLFLVQAEAYFSLMYRRYLKQMVGWKRAMEVHLNQRCLIEKLQKVMVMAMVTVTLMVIMMVMKIEFLAAPFQAVAISSRNNLHCNDLSDYSTINAVDAPKEF